LAAAMLVLGLGATGPAEAAPLAAAPPAARAVPGQEGDASRTVTLVTGDRVTVAGGAGGVSVAPGPGRADMTFLSTTENGRVRVVPSDAAPLLAAGRLDARLFDVTTLIEFGYDRRDDLPLIVTGGTGAPASRARASVATVNGLTVVRDLPAVGGTAIRQTHAGAAESWRALTNGGTAGLRGELSTVWLDGLRKPSLDVSVPQIGAPAAWAAGYSGTGVSVAVLDTGVDDTHPDLAGHVAGRQNFTDGYEDDRDLSGHGTHIASTIAGSGAASGGRYQGVAPGAKLFDGKVCGVGGCADSWILAGMQWAAAEQHAKVVNMSFGGPDEPDVVDPIEQAVQTLSDQYGTLFVIAAGNSDGGIVEGGISSPGTAEAALTVGAVDGTDTLANFSRRGPLAGGVLKPDITAPGVDITAARGKDATALPGASGEPYATISGTSMATPHVVGAAAILAQRHPDWSGQQLKAALMASARPNPATRVHGQGAGRVDVARAINQSVTSTPASVSFGIQSYPHGDDPVLAKNVVYRNDGGADVTLNLALSTTGPDGSPTPAGMFTLNATSVRVPAGGTATVTLTADTRVSGPTGFLGGRLTATAGDLVVQTPLLLQSEVESYDLTLTHLDREGAVPYFFQSRLSPWGGKYEADDISGGRANSDGSVTVRVPKGRYALNSMLRSESSAGPKGRPDTMVLLAQPSLDVSKPMTIVLDARLSQPVSVTVPQPTAVVAAMAIGTHIDRSDGNSFGNTYLGDSFAGLYSARIGPDQAVEDFFMHVSAQFAQANADGTTRNSPYAYILNFPQWERMVTGFDRRVADRDLAKVEVSFARADGQAVGARSVYPSIAPKTLGAFTDMLFDLPFTRTEYYNTEAGVQFWGQFRTYSDEGVVGYNEAPAQQSYRAGQTYREVWNKGVFGPSFPASTVDDTVGISRVGDDINILMPLHTDGAGRAGFDPVTSKVILYRNGAKFAEADSHEFVTLAVPADEAQYRLEIQGERAKPAELSTSVSTAWTFRSGHVGGTTPSPLPLWGVRFAPKLDKFNTAPASQVHPVAVTMTPQAGAKLGKPGKPTIEASFDDGATWVQVQVQGNNALVRHPAGQGFVSLRAKASDSAGNSMNQTVIRAYRYGPVA
jgi:subtilisin family serine protease